MRCVDVDCQDEDIDKWPFRGALQIATLRIKVKKNINKNDFIKCKIKFYDDFPVPEHYIGAQ